MEELLDTLEAEHSTIFTVDELEPILQEMDDATKIMFRPPDEVHVRMSWTIHLIDLA